MGTVLQYPYNLSLKAVEPIEVSFLKMLPAGRTVATAEAWLEKPDGTAAAVDGDNVAVSSPQVIATVGPFTVKGKHAVNFLATCSGAEPKPKLPLRVEFKVEWDDDGV